MSDEKKSLVEESSGYDNFIGEVDSKSLPSTLGGFMGENSDIEDVDIEEWRKHWNQMPSFNQEDNPPYKKLIVSFRTEADYLEFQTLISQKMTSKTKTVWHPHLDKTANSLLRWMEAEDE
jgi:hypothetical protein